MGLCSFQGALRHTSNQTQKLSERIWAPQRNHATSVKKKKKKAQKESKRPLWTFSIRTKTTNYSFGVDTSCFSGC